MYIKDIDRPGILAFVVGFRRITFGLMW